MYTDPTPSIRHLGLQVDEGGIEPPSCATRGRLTASHISYHACQEVRQETRPKTPSARPLVSESMCAEAMHAIPQRSACAQGKGARGGWCLRATSAEAMHAIPRRSACAQGKGQVMVMNAAQAAERAGVRPSTVSRWVQSGRLAAGRLPTGELQIEDGVLDEFLALRTASPRSGPDATVELAVAQERIRGLEALVASQRSWLEESEARLRMVLQALPPPPPARRPWWRWWTGERHSLHG